MGGVDEGTSAFLLTTVYQTKECCKYYRTSHKEICCMYCETEVVFYLENILFSISYYLVKDLEVLDICTTRRIQQYQSLKSNELKLDVFVIR